jgi:sulfur transfer complex TusBCD TusB component (DsrH family)
MRKVLYLLSKTAHRFPDEFLVSPSREYDVSVVLTQEAVALSNVPASQVYALSEDVLSRNVSSPFPKVSHRDLLRMMFEADTVVAL